MLLRSFPEENFVVTLHPKWLALRSTEIHRCFSRNPNEYHAFLHLPHVMRVGQVVRLANMLRLRRFIEYDKAKALSHLLGMQPDTAEVNFETFESLGWLTIHRKHGEPNILEEHIPLLENTIEKIGELTMDPEPEVPTIKPLSAIETASVNALDFCARRPCTEEALRSELGLGDPEFNLIESLGRAGKYLEKMPLKQKSAFLSPIYYFNQYDEIKQFMQRQTVETLAPLGKTLEHCAEYVGQPLQMLEPSEQKIAISGIRTGWLIPVTTNTQFGGVTKDFTFLFPPLSKFQDSHPGGDVFEKAKVLLSSFRLGENFAPTTKIRDPVAVIRKLRRVGRLSKPHSDAFDQYKLPASKGILLLKKETGKTFYTGEEYTGYTPVLIKSEENMKVLDTVESLLERSTEIATKTLENDLKVANEVLKNTSVCLESLEFRGSNWISRFPKEPTLERRAAELALVVCGGAYE